MSATEISAKWAPGTSTKSTPLSEARTSASSPDGELSVEGELGVSSEAGVADGVTDVGGAWDVSASADTASATEGTSAATVALLCRQGGARQQSYRGLFGDAWLTCQLSAPAGVAASVLQDRAGRWCVAVAQATERG